MWAPLGAVPAAWIAVRMTARGTGSGAKLRTLRRRSMMARKSAARAYMVASSRRSKARWTVVGGEDTGTTIAH
jgi:hypothetical protein